MTDIELLRRGVCMQSAQDGSENIEVGVEGTDKLMREAADEIERLRAVIIDAGICWKCDINTAPPVCEVEGCPVTAFQRK